MMQQRTTRSKWATNTSMTEVITSFVTTAEAELKRAWATVETVSVSVLADALSVAKATITKFEPQELACQSALKSGPQYASKSYPPGLSLTGGEARSHHTAQGVAAQ